MKKFTLIVLTPFKKYLTQEIDFLHVKNSESVLGIFANHAPLISTLEISEMYTENNGVRTNYFVAGGIVSIEKNVVTIFTNAIERSDEIDINRAEKSKERALDRLNNSSEKNDIARAKASLTRALVRIKVSNL